MKIRKEYSTDSKKIAKHFNKYFGTIAKKLNKRTPKSKKKFSDYLKNQNLTSFLLSPTTEKEISNIIVSLNARKATGPNSIPNKLECSNYMPMSLLPNISKKIEKAMYTRLYKFLEKYSSLYKKTVWI